MKGCLHVLAWFLLAAFGVGLARHAYERWQQAEKHVVVRMRSSNEDCDEFQCIWKIERVLRGKLTAKEAGASCYLINARRAYSRRDSVEWIEVEGGFTHANGQDFYADCQGTLVFQDKVITPISAAKNRQRATTARQPGEQPNEGK